MGLKEIGSIFLKTIATLVATAIVFSVLYKCCPPAFKWLSFWANTPTFPSIASCKSSAIVENKIMNVSAAKLVIKLDNADGRTSALVIAKDSTSIQDFNGSYEILSSDGRVIKIFGNGSQYIFNVSFVSSEINLKENSEFGAKNCPLEISFLETR